MNKRARVEFYQAKNDEWSWRLKAPNGEIIAVPGETFVSERNARRSFLGMVGNAEEAQMGLIEPSLPSD